jgi:tetratricopeptide (TPR) repeat protein
MLKTTFIASCHALFPGNPLAVAEALIRLSQYLQDFECEIYPSMPSLSSYCFKGDVLRMKQALLASAIQEHIQQVRLTPTQVEVHASLGNTYVLLSKLYRAQDEKFKTYSRLALEELTILSQIGADDPWVHEQMALGYRDLELPEEEMKQVEILRKLRPQDLDILLRLGKLSFAQGMNAKGLRIYEEVKRQHPAQADELLASYSRSTR